MKRRMTVLLAVLLAMALFSPAASAANEVPEMEIEVALGLDGSARVTQTWWANTREGTEFYLACRDSGYLSITDFSVSDEHGPYTLVEDWDVDASFEEKANRCGILETDEGVELCWGISRYGENRYTIQYTLHDLVGGYADADGFNHRFVDEMSFFPTDVALTIRTQDGTPLTDERCDLWAFGFDGEIRFEDGVVRARTRSPLESGQHMTVMVALEKGLLAPLRTVEGSFETVKERAFDGSDYQEDLSAGEILLLVVIMVLLILVILGAVLISLGVQRARLKKRMGETAYFRDAPNRGDLNVTHRLGVCCGLCREDALLGAYLLRLISLGSLEPEAESPEAKHVSLRLLRPPRGGSDDDQRLYQVLEAAAGEDGVLQPRELDRYCKRNGAPLYDFVESCIREANQTLVRTGCVRGAVCRGLKDLTPQGNRELDELLGLKRFLLDFSLIHQRGVQETMIWQEYMVYALLLGIARKVAPQIRELYPEALPQIDRFERCADYAGYYNTLLYGAYVRERQRLEAARGGGSGGHASFGGGGGFSGGGGGGIR